jgi:hypothetical protein
MRISIRWQILYQAAMVELDPAELRIRVGLASVAIRQRREELRSVQDPGSVEELRAIADALDNLASLERIELISPRATVSRSMGSVDEGRL